MSSEWVVALDLGTSSVRAVAYDAQARPVEGHRHQIGWQPRTQPPGASEFDAEALLEGVVGCLDALASGLPLQAHSGVLAVGCCSFWHSSVGVDIEGTAITPVITWADTRSAEHARRLTHKMDAERLHAVTGCAPHTSYLPARLLWFREAFPELFHRVHRWLSPADYVLARLTGVECCSISMASGTGLFDQRACRWDPAILTVCGIQECHLPPVVDLDRPLGRLLPRWRARWPVLAEAVWMPAVGDGAASNLGSGCVTERHAAINLGTSGAIRVLWPTDTLSIPSELWCYRLDRHTPIMGGAFSDGGNLYEWCRKTLALESDEAVQADLNSREPGSSGLTLVPFFGGERSTRWRADSTGAITGLSLSTTALDVLHAAMEAVALRFALVWRLLQRQFPALDTLVLSGGAATDAWARMIVDAVGHSALLSADTEATSRGAALIALRQSGRLTSWSLSTMPEGKVLHPDPKRHARSLELLDSQERLISSLEETR